MSDGVKVTDHSVELAEAMREGLLKGLAAAGFKVQALAMGNIRDEGLIDTGAMLNAVYVETPDMNQRDEMVAAARARNSEAGTGAQGRPLESDEVRIAEAMEYGIYHEMGTKHVPARPYLGPAAEQVRKELPEIVGREVKKAMEAGKLGSREAGKSGA